MLKRKITSSIYTANQMSSSTKTSSAQTLKFIAKQVTINSYFQIVFNISSNQTEEFEKLNLAGTVPWKTVEETGETFLKVKIPNWHRSPKFMEYFDSFTGSVVQVTVSLHPYDFETPEGRVKGVSFNLQRLGETNITPKPPVLTRE